MNPKSLPSRSVDPAILPNRRVGGSLVAPIAWLAAALPLPVVAGDAASSPTCIRPVRRVYVHRIGPDTAEAAGGELVLGIQADALGLRWRTLDLDVRLQTADGKPVRVAADAPAGYADKRGFFRMAGRAPILGNEVGWNDLRATIPLEKLLGRPPGDVGPLTATVKASSEGLVSSSQAEIVFDEKGQPRVSRAVGLLAVDVYVDRLADAEDLPSAETSAKPARAGRGLTVWGYVEAVGLGRSEMTGTLRLGRPADPRVPSAGEGRDAFRKIVNEKRREVAPDQAQVFCHFVPYGDLGLKPGPNRLTVRYAASCAGLSAAVTEEYVVEGRSER